MIKLKYISLLVVLFAFVACSGLLADNDDETTITIDNDTFDPVEFTAEPGELITVVNDDDESHTVTSQSDEDEFDDTGDFDTGTIEAGETDSFTIPADAEDGDTFFFYCDIHTSSMATPNGTITIEE